MVQNGGGVLQSQGLLPLYPATEGLTRERIRNLMWRERAHVHDVVEPLPSALRRAERLPDRPAALSAIHFPEEPGDSGVARERLAFEELLLLELSLAARKRARAAGARAPEVRGDGSLVDPWLATLPFAPTGDQDAAFARDRERHDPRPAHAAAADGRGRVGQDRRRPARDAARGRGRLPGRADGAHRDARRAAHGHARPAARRPRADRAADRVDPRRAAARAARAPRDRRAAADRRHPRADRARRRVPGARPRGRRRAAPVRRAPAGGARREGGRAASRRTCCT